LRESKRQTSILADRLTSAIDDKSIYQQCTNNNADYTDEDFYIVNILHGGSSLYWNSIQLTIKQQAPALSAHLF
jgi:hypothetical protein